MIKLLGSGTGGGGVVALPSFVRAKTLPQPEPVAHVVPEAMTCQEDRMPVQPLIVYLNVSPVEGISGPLLEETVFSTHNDPGCV